MPILAEGTLDFLSHSPEQTLRIGVRLGELIRPGDVICMTGDLGTGKTTMAQGIARGWGSLEAVTSPTYVLLKEYRRADSSRLYHLDAFRLRGMIEALHLGFDEILEENAPLLIEWPENISGALPEKRLWINLRWVEESRRGLFFSATGARYERLLREFRKIVIGG